MVDLENIKIEEKEEKARKALEVICANCKNQKACEGLCNEKDTLEKVIDYAEKVNNWAIAFIKEAEDNGLVL